MSGELVVHDEWRSILVPAARFPGTYYRVVDGAVDWNRNGGLERAIVVFMQYGTGEKGWAKAKSMGEIAFKLVPHILLEDVPDVMEAIHNLSATEE